MSRCEASPRHPDLFVSDQCCDRKVEQVPASFTVHRYMFAIEMKKWICTTCGYIYDEAVGLPEQGLFPGTRFEELPDDWICLECCAGKEAFEIYVEY